MADLEELRARKAAAAQELADAEAAAVAPALAPDVAAKLLADAEAALKVAEGPKWELEHARFDLATLVEEKNLAEKQESPARVARAEEAIPAAQARLEAAQAAYDAHPPSEADIDAASQRVIDARDAVARANTTEA